MKSIKNFTVFVLSCMIVVVSFTACSKDDNIIDQPPTPPTSSGYPLSDITVTASGYIKAGVKSNLLTSGNAPSADDVTITHLTEDEAKAHASSTTGDAGKTFFLYRWTTLNYRCNTADIPHPYCNRELTAEQVVTGVKAGLSYFEANVSKMEDGWTGVAIGYSQGGAVAAGVLRYCQEHSESALRLQGAVCGDGPYDPLATLKRYIEMDKLYMPVAPAMLLKGVIDTDPDMKTIGCNYHDFVTDAFYNTGIFEISAHV